MDWYVKIIPSHRSFLSADHCCISIMPGNILLVIARRAQSDNENTIFKSYSYNGYQELKAALVAIVDEYDLAGARCTWILNSEQYQLLQTDALPVAANEFQAAIRWKVKDLIRFPIADAVIEHFTLPIAKLPTSHNMIMLVVARASVLTPLCELINASGLNLTTIDVPELCLAKLAIMDEQGEKSTAFLYLQEESSQLLLTHQAQLYFTRRLNYGLKSILADMNVVIDELSLDLQRSFDFFQSQWRLPEPARVVMAGGGTIKEDLVARLVQRMNTLVTTVDLKHFCNPGDVTLTQEGIYLPLLGGVMLE